MGSPSVYIRGMMEVDDKYEAMIALKRACEKAGVDYPQELIDYFGRDPDEGEYELKIGKFGVDILAVDTGGGGIHDWSTNMELIDVVTDENVEDAYLYDIHLDRLPQALKTLRLEVNW
jgi:hypothetical protein